MSRRNFCLLVREIFSSKGLLSGVEAGYADSQAGPQELTQILLAGCSKRCGANLVRISALDFLKAIASGRAIGAHPRPLRIDSVRRRQIQSMNRRGWSRRICQRRLKITAGGGKLVARLCSANETDGRCGANLIPQEIARLIFSPFYGSRSFFVPKVWSHRCVGICAAWRPQCLRGRRSPSAGGQMIEPDALFCRKDPVRAVG